MSELTPETEELHHHLRITVGAMRASQKLAARTKSQISLRTAKELEEKTDAILVRIELEKQKTR